MKLKPKLIFLVAIVIVISGFFTSFKSFQIYQNQTFVKDAHYGELLSQLVGQEVEQKLMQMEAAVSYLDKSTIESLKRFGARYFVYAYKKDGEWSFKWKVLGDTGKEQILNEVNVLPFDKYDTKKRHWTHSKENKLIYIAPVQLAKNHQLTEGFLVFGVAKDFFRNIQGHEATHALISPELLDVHGTLPLGLSKEALAPGEAFEPLKTVSDGTAEILTAYFSPVAQLWVVRTQHEPVLSFFQTSFFTYFFLVSLLGVILLYLFLMQGMGFAMELPKKISPQLSRLRFRRGRSNESQTSVGTAERISDFAEFLDEVLAEDQKRLEKVGVQLKTQLEDGAEVVVSKKHIEDFIKRLVGNSVLSLENEKEKEIQIQLVEQKESFQLIYVDTRSQNFPTQQGAPLMAQTEGSLEGIDGIISYARWIFADRLTVAKKGFCLSVDLPKPAQTEAPVQAMDFVHVEADVDAVERIEIHEHDTDMNLIGDFVELDAHSKKDGDQPTVSFDDVIEQFRMKEFNFTDQKMAEVEKEVKSMEKPKDSKVDDFQEVIIDSGVTTDEKGLFELSSGDFKIKIRSPKKKDLNVDR